MAYAPKIWVLAVSAAMVGTSFGLEAHPEWASARTGVEALDATNAIAAEYGQTTSAMIVVEARDSLFTPARLAALKRYVGELRASGRCQAVLSFFALPAIVSHDDETEVRDLVEQLPSTQSEADRLRERVLAHANGKDELVSADGKAALVICPLISGATTDWPTVPDALQVWDVGPRVVSAAFARDLGRGGLLFAVFGVLVVVAAQRSGASRRLAVGAAIAGIGLLAGVAPAWWSNASGTVMGRLLGPGASATLARLQHVTSADRTVLASIKEDLDTAAGITALRQACDQAASLGAVRCPTDVLGTMATALTGEPTLPRTDEQAKALWFFAGDRPELRLVFGAEHKSALIRIQLAPETTSVGWGRSALGGLPLVTLDPFVLPLLCLLAAGFALGWLKRASAGVRSTGVALTLAALAVPPAIAAWPLGVLGAGLSLGSGLAPQRETREGDAP